MAKSRNRFDRILYVGSASYCYFIWYFLIKKQLNPDSINRYIQQCVVYVQFNGKYFSSTIENVLHTDLSFGCHKQRFLLFTVQCTRTRIV